MIKPQESFSGLCPWCRGAIKNMKLISREKNHPVWSGGCPNGHRVNIEAIKMGLGIPPGIFAPPDNEPNCTPDSEAKRESYEEHSIYCEDCGNPPGANCEYGQRLSDAEDAALDPLSQAKSQKEYQALPLPHSTGEAFHAHLDVCKQCEKHPFDLCERGAELLQEAIKRA